MGKSESMNAKTNGIHPAQISWTSIVTVLLLGAALMITAASAGWTIFQSEFANVEKIANADRERTVAAVTELKTTFSKYLTEKEHEAYTFGIRKELDTLKGRIDEIQRIQGERATKLAHDPVEQKTIDAINSAIDKRIDLIQGQITDINRQIAAALIIIDNNSAIRKSPSTLPP
jgi:hypothetical protein